MTSQQPASPHANSVDGLPGNVYRTYVLIALAVVGFMCSVDKVVITMFMEVIKAEFVLTDSQLGLLAGFAFAVLSGIISLPLARLADRGNRKWIIVGSFTVWTAMTAACGMAGSFFQLLAARVGVGVGEAGCVPATHSMLGDYYPRPLRPRALAVHGAGVFLGVLGGMLGGGYLLQTVGWRAGFIILGVVGLILAGIFHLTVREPERMDSMVQPTDPGTGIWSLLGDLRSFGLLVMAFATASLAGSAIITWLPSYFARTFGLPPVRIGLGLGLCLGLSTALGSMIGGQLANHKFRGSGSWGVKFSAIVVWILGPFYIVSLLVTKPMAAFVLLFITYLLAGAINGPIYATLQDMVSPHARASAVAILAVSAIVFGNGIGPLLVGAISDQLQDHYPGAASLRVALIIVAMLNFGTGILFWLLGRRIDAAQALPMPASPKTV